MKRSFLIYLLTSLITLSSCKSKNEIESTWSAEANIEALWQTIDTKYCFVEEKGADWDAIHEEYINKAKLLESEMSDSKNYQERLFDLCAAMLDSLKDGHVNLYSWFDVSAYSGWYDNAPTNFNSSLVFTKYVPSYRMAGGLYYGRLSNELTTDTIGYIYYSSFSNSCANIAGVLSKLSDCKAVIIDVRSNGGGDLTNAYDLAAPFFERETVVGYWQHKNGPGHNDFSELEEQKITPNKHVHWLRPVYVLTNRRCYSATNAFVNCMTNAEHATIIGDKTGGGGGMPLSYELPCGWMVRFSSVKMYNVNKESIEQGIQPDIKIDIVNPSQRDDIIEKVIYITKRQAK